MDLSMKWLSDYVDIGDMRLLYENDMRFLGQF